MPQESDLPHDWPTVSSGSPCSSPLSADWLINKLLRYQRQQPVRRAANWETMICRCFQWSAANREITVNVKARKIFLVFKGTELNAIIADCAGLSPAPN